MMRNWRRRKKKEDINKEIDFSRLWQNHKSIFYLFRLLFPSFFSPLCTFPSIFLWIYLFSLRHQFFSFPTPKYNSKLIFNILSLRTLFVGLSFLFQQDSKINISYCPNVTFVKPINLFIIIMLIKADFIRIKKNTQIYQFSDYYIK